MDYLFATYGNGGGIHEVIKGLKNKTLQTFERFSDLVPHMEIECPYFVKGTYDIYPYAHDDRIGHDVLIVTADYKGYKAQYVCYVVVVPKYGTWFKGNGL